MYESLFNCLWSSPEDQEPKRENPICFFPYAGTTAASLAALYTDYFVYGAEPTTTWINAAGNHYGRHYF